MIRLNDSEFEAVVAYMKEHYGINLNKKKVLIECRMTKVLEAHGITSFGKYLELLRTDQSGTVAVELVGQLTTNYTYFMREPEHFTILRENVLPIVLNDNSVRDSYIWCAGCSTGEECYTLAMELAQFCDISPPAHKAKILATDISESVLEKARLGCYSLKTLASLPVFWQKSYCHTENKRQFRIDDRIRRDIRFVKHNLMERPPYPEKFDIIFCRNVMIYFDKDVRARLLSRLEAALNPGGYLFVGHAELLSQNETGLELAYPAVYRKPERNGGR